MRNGMKEDGMMTCEYYLRKYRGKVRRVKKGFQSCGLSYKCFWVITQMLT